MALVIFSLGMFASLAVSIAARNLWFVSGSFDPSLAATVISREIFENIWDLNLSCLPFLCFGSGPGGLS